MAWRKNANQGQAQRREQAYTKIVRFAHPERYRNEANGAPALWKNTNRERFSSRNAYKYRRAAAVTAVTPFVE